MNRLEKKCFIASAGLHLFLFLLVIFGSAFLVSNDKTITVPTLRFVPTKLIDSALSGGGGNPDAKPSEAQQKGQTLVPQAVQAQPPAKIEKKPEPKPEVKKVEKVKPVKPPKEVAKESLKPLPDPSLKPSKDEIVLKPITRNATDRAKEKAEAEAKQRAEAEAKAAREAAAARGRAAKEIAQAATAIRTGFSQGTAVDIPYGPGGEAYADYTQFVKSVYEDAWIVTDDLTDEDSTAKVSVTIAKSGHVISARIDRRSGNPVLDKSVQRALDSVTFVRQFPADARDEQRTFVINFNLKSKRLSG